MLHMTYLAPPGHIKRQKVLYSLITLISRVVPFPERRKRERGKERKGRADEGSPQRNISKDNLYILER